MKRLFSTLVVLSILYAAGCHRLPRRQARESAPESKRVVTHSTDPFLSVSYDDAEIGRPEQAPRSREAAQPQIDPFDQFFQEMGSFGDISSQRPVMAPTTSQDQRQDPPDPRTPPMQSGPTYSTFSSPREPTFTPTRMSFTGHSTNILTMTEPGPRHVSVTYPSSEYGVIKVDKVIPREVNLEQTFKYSIHITNLTNTTLNSIVLTETLAQNYEFESASPSPQQIPGSLIWQIDSLGPKSTEEVEIYGRAKNINAMKHRTTLTYAVVSSTNIRVVRPELELTRRAPAETLLCDAFPVEYIITNVGTGSAKEVRIYETLPSGLKTTDGSAEVSFTVGTLRAGQSRSFAAELRANRRGLYANKAMASSSSNTRAESAPTATSVRQPALVITKSGPERQYLGRSLGYEITVINRGDGTALKTILEDTIPSDITQVEVSAGAEVTGNRLRWDLGSIAANASKSIRVSYKPSKVGIFTSDTTVSAHCTETVSSSTSTAVVGIPIVRLDVVDLQDPVEVGENVTYVITATNDGSAPDHNVRVVCQLEDKIQYVSSSGATHASVMGRTINFTPLRTLSPGTKATWRVIAKAAKPGSVRFKVTMTSDELTRPIDETEASYLYE